MYPALLANCNLHVTTSEKETRGLTILEALAAGIPVLAPNSGGVIENIHHGLTVYYILQAIAVTLFANSRH